MNTSESIHPDKVDQSVTTVTRVKLVGKIGSYRQEQGVFIFEGEHGCMMVQPINEHIVRVKLLVDGQLDLYSTIAVQKDAQSEVASSLQDTEDVYIIDLPLMKVHIYKNDGRIDYYTKDDKLISGEIESNREGRNMYSSRRLMEEGSHIYGLGEKTGFLDKVGEKYDMWNSDVYDPHMPDTECLYVSIPFLIHFRYDKPVYGIFLDNPGRTTFDMRTEQHSYTFKTQTGAWDYYFIYGPDMKDVVSKYSELTGRMELPPVWAIGYQQSRYSYMTQEEVLTIARTFREKEIPCDVIHLDIHYMDEYRVFTFDPVRFPNPRQMIDELKEMGIRIVPIVDPGVKRDPDYAPYRDGIIKGYFCRKLEGDVFIGDVWPGPSAFPDFTEEEVRQWWGDQHSYYTELGVAGIWNDMNEPSVFHHPEKTLDFDVLHGNDGRPKTHQELHNLYGMLMSMATQQGLKRNLKGERPFVVTRAGYAGIQKYAATWTGDNRSYWEHLALSIPMVLNLGLSGQPFAGPDIGGFSHHTTPELLARWTQVGAFFPFCRNHSVIESIRQEPWVFGEQIEEICRKYIRLRYQFLPYMYTLFYEAHRTGLPIIRPLILEYPNDRKVYNQCDQFLLGSDVLIAPVLRPGTEARAVYLPEGEWIDYWNGEKITGGRHILANAPLDIMPIYVKAGAVIPMLCDESWKPVLDEHSDVTVQIFVPSQALKTAGKWYMDDGKTYAYEEGAYNLLNVCVTASKEQLILGLEYEVQGIPVASETRRTWPKFNVKALDHTPQSIIVRTGDRQCDLQEAGGSWTYNDATSELTLLLSDRIKPGEQLDILIKF